MVIVTGHINSDFDSIASIIAASKLYPHAQMILPGIVGKDVREFLNLYRDTFDFKTIREIDIDNVKRVIVVDTHSKSRIENELLRKILNSNVDIHVYDHHMHCEDKLSTSTSTIEEVGANTTLLVEEIIKQNIEISAIEATVFALGIYSDTNCLTFSGTTSRDAYALAYLISKDANLQVIEDYMTVHLSPAQQTLMELLNRGLTELNIKGFEIAITTVELDYYVDDAAFLIRRILEERNYDALFSIMRMGKKVYIIGRSLVQEVDIGKIMNHFDGGGHLGAGSAKTSQTNLSCIADKVKTLLEETIRPVTRAKDIMSSPVKSVTEDCSVEEVHKIMLRFGHSGLPVVKNGLLCGIASRRDIEKARIHELGDSPVKAYMSKNVISVDSETSVKEIQQIMTEHNIGRLPVLEGNRLIGIITRSDIIRVIFGEDAPKTFNKNYDDKSSISTLDNQSISNKIDKLPERLQDILTGAGRLADKYGYNIYVVGGFVRDLILEVENLDIDIVVEGNAINFAREFSKMYSAQFTGYDKFQTALVVLQDDFTIDMVTARKEYYEYPAALPVVENGSIKDDLYRRDFTINSMAIKLNSSEFGSLVDFYGGIRDLQNGLIRILYNLSFVEDPTRIFRAIRFEQRYGFKMEERTEEFAVSTINSEVLDEVSKERLNFEFFALLKEKNVPGILERMDELGLLRKAYPEIYLTEDIKKMFKTLDDRVNIFQNSLKFKENLDKILLCVLILHSNMDLGKISVSCDRMRLTKEYREEAIKLASARDVILPLLKDNCNMSNYDVYSNLKDLSPEVLFVLSIVEDCTVIMERIIFFMNDLKSIKLEVTGTDLIEIGIKPGPTFRDILSRTLKEKVNGNISTYEEELEYIKMIKRFEG